MTHSIHIPPTAIVADLPCELHQIPLADDYSVWARYFESPNPKRALLYLHGIQSHGGWFLRSADYLHHQGHTVLLPDRRGSGLNAADRGHAHSPKQLLEDTDRAADWGLAAHAHRLVGWADVALDADGAPVVSASA